ncbi:uncharacterized protein CTRU02_209934 [Colletotrichum truncatum]|uniref:Uncharacterized protein n=1 Tax=Colletotrichum truncatum TaxID=5467 RepID=A0ACC3YTR6_COLTU|nr:uncharacterized protein CTRU02_02504 [Colletotrichum truncatum]KAF6798530.1 hypothetical protein CTRU02_02504 [Colletotrichum truncatum]
MALEAPLRSSIGSQISAYSHHNEMSVSSPEIGSMQSPFITMSSTSSDHLGPNSLRPNSIQRLSSNNMNLMSPSDIVGPSPVTSTGTETTEIEDEEAEEVRARPTSANPLPHPQLMMLTTNIPDHVRQVGSEEAVSVIHAPESFHSWVSNEPTVKPDQASEKSSPRSDSKSSPKSDSRSSPRTDTISLPSVTGHAIKVKYSEEQSRSPGLPTPPPLSTDVRPVRYSVDSATPRAQDLQDMLNESSRLRSSSTSSLEKIDEARGEETDAETYDDDYATPSLLLEDSEIRALRTALQECWTLCNTLANLSSIHRTRVFNKSGTPDAHEKAWMACWKLCQRLYDNQDEDLYGHNVRENLDLCRDFCQSLFDVRQKKDEVADSILRVSFELNNHLYSAQDIRNLPEQFRERTLDFYITLCHRLMKQRSELADETDSLLKACWSLAEMLFSLRQNKRDGRAPDEELLGSAVQACWELCDLFRDGWTQVRPDRNTPRPNQTSFFGHQQNFEQPSGRESRASNRSSYSKRESHKTVTEERPRKPPPVPETPVTEFEDTPISPESQSPRVPNILVLGTTSDSGRGGRWSSSASQLSSYSQSSNKTSSTATTTTASEESNTSRIKALVLKAAMNVGYSRDPALDSKAEKAALQAFVKQMPPGSFGSLPTHATLLQNYKSLVQADASFRGSSLLPARGKRIAANDMAKSVNYMAGRASQYVFLRDLYRLVFSFPTEEGESRKSVSIAV